MLTLAQRTQLRKRAAREAAEASPHGSMEGATRYELQLAKLLQDRLRLKQIQSTLGRPNSSGSFCRSTPTMWPACCRPGRALRTRC